MGGEFVIAGNRRGKTKMTKEQRAFIAKLIKRLGDEDWDRWMEEEKQSMDSLKIPSNDVFYDNLYKKIEHEIDKLKDE
jgi:enolase